MKIPKLQTASQKLTLSNDNTRVAVTPSYLNNYRLVKLRQQYLQEKAKESENQAIKNYVQNRDSQTVTADNRTAQQREQEHKHLEQVRQQQHQQQQKQQNAEAFGQLVAGATAPLNYLSVSQHYRAAKETDNWRDYLKSIRKGNSGFVSEEFHQSAPILSTLINLGGDVAAGVGALKGLSLLGKGVKLATPAVSLARNSTGQWNGWINVGNRQWRPNRSSLGINKLVESRPNPGIAWPARKGFNPILEEDIPELRKMYNEGKFREMTVQHPRKPSETVRMYFLPNKKQPISEQELEKLLEKYNPPLSDQEFNNPILTESAKTELGKAKKTYKKIKEKYSEEIEDLKNQIEQDYGAPINWNWYDGGILSESNIPAKVAISPIFDPRYGKVVDPRSVMQRFYENILNKDGIIQRTQKYLLNNKIVEPFEGKWVYQPPGRESRDLVDPTRFTLNWILENELHSTNRIPFVRELERPGLTFIPYHSTPIGDKTISQLFIDPSRRPLFASIDDGSKGFYPLKRAYQRSQYGTSIPVFTKTKSLEGETLISENGLHSSNNYGDVGELMSHFQKNGGRPQKVMEVSDARNIKGNTGQRQNEYNYGTGTPDIGFILNTLDLEHPARIVGPFQGFKKGGRINKN